MKKIILTILFIFAIAYTFFLIKGDNKAIRETLPGKPNTTNVLTTTPTPQSVKLPDSYEIPLRTHVFQRFNNCGPASLSMALSYHDVYITQEQLGQELRPYQNANGDNDDKSVTLDELAKKAEELGFVSYHRPNGNYELVKNFVSQGIPVITRTTTKTDEDIGHYRVIRGYTQNGIIQDDSLQGKGLFYTTEEFNLLWKTFNFEYLVFVPPDKVELAKQILGPEADIIQSWEKARLNAQNQLNMNPSDIYARFNLSVALYHTGELEKSVEEFEQVQSRLPFRTLWYQIEPILAYYDLGNYDKVFSITDNIINNQNRAYSELYIIRGDIYLKQGQTELAKMEYEKAVLYNKYNKLALEKLEQITKTKCPINYQVC